MDSQSLLIFLIKYIISKLWIFMDTIAAYARAKKKFYVQKVGGIEIEKKICTWQF